jgi:hypothetical protein
LQGEIILVPLNNKPASAGVTIPLDVYVAHIGCRHHGFQVCKSSTQTDKKIPITVEHLFLSLNNTVMHHYMMFSFTA